MVGVLSRNDKNGKPKRADETCVHSTSLETSGKESPKHLGKSEEKAKWDEGKDFM
jgi:hypothetical protein